MDSLQQNIHNNNEEIRRLTGLLAAKEEGRGSGHEEEELRAKISDLKAQLTKEEDQKTKAEEKLKNLQSRVAEMDHKDNVGGITCICIS